jgi:ferredoxin
MLPVVTPRISAKVARMPDITVTVGDRCIGCGTCTQGVCFADAIHLAGERAVIGEACRGCGRCVDVCPQDAIMLSIETGSYVEQSIARISPLVDVS